MAYKRTTRSKKVNGVTTKQTTTSSTKGGLTVSRSQKMGGMTSTQNSKGDAWITLNNNGVITRRKLNKKAPAKRKKKVSPSGGSVSLKFAGACVVAILFLLWVL